MDEFIQQSGIEGVLYLILLEQRRTNDLKEVELKMKKADLPEAMQYRRARLV